MRTKEKFYKNLKGYISKEDRIQRLDLRDVKTLDSMSREAQKFRSALIKESDKADVITAKLRDAEKKRDETAAKLERAEDIVIATQNENKKRLEKVKKDEDKVFADFNKTKEIVNDAFDKHVEQKAKEETAKRVASAFKLKFENAIKEFESSARALGVDVSNKVSSYKSIAEDVDQY